MADEPLTQQLVTLRSLLDDVHARLARAPATPAGLEDLKRSVDTLRTNMWAILSAGQASASVRVERLKLRRAVEGLRGFAPASLRPGPVPSTPNISSSSSLPGARQRDRQTPMIHFEGDHGH